MEKPYSRGRPVHPEYAKLGFRRIKVDGKNSVVCDLCKCVLQNTATKRLRGHRNVCPQNVKKEDVSDREESYIETVSPKNDDPLYARTSNDGYIELHPPSPPAEYAEYSDEDEVTPTQSTPQSQQSIRIVSKFSPRSPTISHVQRKQLQRTPVRTADLGSSGSISENVTEVVKQIFDSLGGMLAQYKPAATSHSSDSTDDAFCNWLLSQFSGMSSQRKLRLQHEISNLIFRAQTDETSGDM